MVSIIERLSKEKAEREAAIAQSIAISNVSEELRAAEIRAFAMEDVDAFLEAASYEEILELEKKLPMFTVANERLASIYNGNILTMLRGLSGNGYLLNRYINHGLSLEDRDVFFSWIDAVRNSFHAKWGEIKKAL